MTYRCIIIPSTQTRDYDNDLYAAIQRIQKT